MYLSRESKVMVPLVLNLTFPKEISQVIEVPEIAVLQSVCAMSNKR